MTNNKLGETMFAYFDFRYRRSPNFLVSTVSGMVMAAKNKVFEKGGAWESLTQREQDSLMVMVVKNFDKLIKENWQVLEAQLDYNQERRKLELDAALLKAKRAYSDCVRFYRLADQHRITSASALDEALAAKK